LLRLLTAAGHKAATSRWGRSRPVFATGPLRYDAPVPFLHFYGGKMQKDILS
jgi:hypothetical protein